MSSNPKIFPDTTFIDNSRRAILIGAGAAAALGTVGSAFAAAHKHRSKAKGLIRAAEHCEDVSEACLAHCFETFKAGSLELAQCAA